jgi:sugar phosphate isomerase/epimerase
MRISAQSLPPLGIAHFTVIDVEPMALVDMAARIGYAAVGLRLHPAFPGAPYYRIPTGGQQMRAMRDRLADTGVRVHDIEFVVIDAAFVPVALDPVLASAAELGARRISVCGDDPDRGRLVANFGELCDLAAGYGMGVDLETMAWRRVNTLDATAAVVREAGLPNGGVLIDALHLARCGSVPEDLRALPDRFIRSVQLCDAVAERPADTDAIIREARAGRLAPGEGALPLRRLLAEVPDDAVLSVEVPNSGSDPEAHATRVFHAARAIIADAAT